MRYFLLRVRRRLWRTALSLRVRRARRWLRLHAPLHTIPPELFHERWYLSQLPLAERTINDPLHHFLTQGDALGLSPHPCFDPSLFLSQLSMDSPVPARPFQHYWTEPSTWHSATHPWFDGSYYFACNPDVAASLMNPLFHYLSRGEAEGRLPSAASDLPTYRHQLSATNVSVNSELTAYALDAAPSEITARVAALEDAARVERLATPEALVANTTSSPDVQVIVMAHGDAPLLHHCLVALAGQSASIAITVVCEQLTPEAREALGRWTGISLVDVDAESTVVEAINAAVGAGVNAKAYAVLTSNVFARPDSIASALRVLADTGSGAVVGKTVNVNGLIDAAGHYRTPGGREQRYLLGEPEAHVASWHRRTVDVLPDSCVVFRRDEGPTTLLESGHSTVAEALSAKCSELATRGVGSCYDPRIIVDIARAPGRDDLTQPDANQHALAHAIPGGRDGTLIIDDRLPVPSYGAGYPRAHALALSVRRVTGRHVIHVALNEDPGLDWAELRHLADAGVECHTVQGEREFADAIRRHGPRVQRIVAARIPSLTLCLELRAREPDLFDNLALIYDSEALGVERERLRADLAGESWTAEHYASELEREILPARAAHSVAAVTEGDKELLLAHGVPRVVTLPHALDARPDAPRLEARNGIVFLGRLLEPDSPNTDSVRWFLRECYPQIRAATGAPFVIAGRVADALAREFSNAGATVLGEVRDLSATLDAARVFVAPTRFAGGIPIKVLTAAAEGIPVVCTSVLNRQLGWDAGSEIAVASDAESFIAKTIRLLTDDEQWETLRANSMSRMQREFSIASFDSTVARLLA